MLWGRGYFAVQAVTGAAWWVAVGTVPVVRRATLGELDVATVAVFDVPLFVFAAAAAAAGVRWAAWVTTAWTCLVTVALAIYSTWTAEAGWGVLLMAGAAGASIVALCLVVLGRIPTAWIASGPFRPRPAAPRRGYRSHVAATSAQIAVFWGFFLLVVPTFVRALERRWQVDVPFPAIAVPFGTILLVVASGLGIWAAVVMSVGGDGTPLPAATANRLVIAGPYRVIRNPMAVSGITQGVAVGLIMSSWLVVAYAVVGSLLWNFAIRPLEESDLEARFGEPFRQYRDSVRCWIPALRRPNGASTP